MAQFDIHRLPDGLHVVDLQTDLIDLPQSRLAAPMFRVDERATLAQLTPVVLFDDRTWMVRIPQMSVMRPRDLGPAIGSAASWRDEIFRAIDILTHGF